MCVDHACLGASHDNDFSDVSCNPTDGDTYVMNAGLSSGSRGEHFPAVAKLQYSHRFQGMVTV